jgi:hypothetical protein
MKGKKLGRPRTGVNPEQVATLRAAGASWRAGRLRVAGHRRRYGRSSVTLLFQKPTGIMRRKCLILRRRQRRFHRSRTRRFWKGGRVERGLRWPHRWRREETTSGARPAPVPPLATAIPHPVSLEDGRGLGLYLIQ